VSLKEAGGLGGLARLPVFFWGGVGLLLITVQLLIFLYVGPIDKTAKKHYFCSLND
jgi:hypothetical protein